jgi:tetratricopeptide (TPR) repeat protein
MAAVSPAEPVSSKGPSRRTVAIVAAAVLVSLVPVVGGLLVALVGKPDATKPPATAAPTPGSAAERVAKARELLDDDPFITRRNVELAEQFALEAIAKDASSAEAFAAAAWVNYRFLERNYEDTPKRRADLRSYAEKAKLLAPDSVNAELAACGLLMVNGNWTEANQRMEKLVERAPSNLTVLRAALSASASHHGTAFDSNRMPEASLERLRAHSPLGRSYADVEVIGVHWRKGEYVEADRLLDGIFASGHPVSRAYILRLLVLTFGWGDLAASRQFAATIPSTLLLEDAFINHLSKLELYSGDYAKALETLGRSQRSVLKEGSVEIPTAGLRGDVHQAAGRSAAAALQWREALKTIDPLLAIRPDEAYLRRQKAIILAKLGERKEAAAEFALARELAGKPATGSVDWGREVRYYVAIGDKDGAIARLDRLLQRDVGRWPNIYSDLRHDPALRALHGDPRVKAMLERGARWLAEMKAAAKP